jgi:CHASE1-domain containing sensor protein
VGKLNTGLVALRAWLAGVGLGRGGAAPAYGVLLISLVLTALAYYYVRQNVEAQSRLRFEETAQATQEAIERRTKAYLDAMLGARALFYASRSVDRGEWDNYVEGIEPSENFEGLQALSYAESVLPEEREAFFSSRMREQGLPELRPDLSPGGERKAYFPLTYTGPLNEANASMLGYDFYAERSHQEAMDLARDSGEPQATRMVYVLTESTESSSSSASTSSSAADLALKEGFVVYLPVFEDGRAQEEGGGTVSERREALKGFVAGFFVIEDLLGGVFRGAFEPAIDFEVYDDGKKDVAAPSSPLLYDSDGIKRGGEGGEEPLFSREDRIEVAGRKWSLYFASLPRFEEGLESSSKVPTFVLASGVGVSLLLFGISWMLVRSRTLAEGASTDLEDANRELEAFSYSVSHDLRAPLRSIEGFSQILLEDYADKLDEEGKDYLGRVRAASRRMALLIDDLLDLSRVSRRPLRRELVDLSAQTREIAAELGKSQPEREAEFVIADGLTANGDARLLRLALENLLNNAWKFTSRRRGPG